MSLLREASETGPVAPDGGWNVGTLAYMGILLTCEGFTCRFDMDNLEKFFDLVENNWQGNIRDDDGTVVRVIPDDDGIVLIRKGDENYPFGLILDLGTLKEMGIEAYDEDDEDDPESKFDSLDSGDKIDEFDPIDEGVKRAYRRVGKKIKRGYRVTSGFRKGRVVSSPAGAYKPRAKASTRSKLRIAANRKKIIRVMKGKRTRRQPTSRRLVRMNKR